MKKIIFPILLIAVLCLSCQTTNSKGSANIAENFKLPSFADNNDYQLTQFSGKPVVLNFWASWCAPCRQEMPFLESIWKEYEDKGLVLVGINILDDKQEAKDTLKEFNISYLNLYDGEGEVKNIYNLLALPVTYFIDKNGTISKINYGPFLGEEGEELFNKQLQEIMK